MSCRLNLVIVICLSTTAAASAKVMCEASDQAQIYPGNHAFAEAIYACSGISGLDVDCFNETYPGMSEGCVSCYEDMASCTVKSCIGSCMFSPRGTGCRDCARRECGEALSECIGMPKEESPDFDRTKKKYYRFTRLRTSAQIF